MWRLRVYLGAGRQKSETFHGTEMEAWDRLDELVVEMRRQAIVSGTVEALVVKWLAQKRHDLSPATYRSYVMWWELYLQPAVGSMQLSELRGRHLDDLYQRLLAGRSASGKALNPATIGQVHAVIRGACKQAVKWELIGSNPALAATPPKLRKFEIQPPDVEAISAALAAVESNPDLALFLRIAATTGARRGEVCALRWSDLDLDASVVTFAHSMVDIPRHPLELKSTKTGTAKRLALDARTVELLGEHRDRQQARAVRDRVEMVVDPFVFSAGTGATPWRPNQVSLAWRRVRRDARLPSHVRLHDFRHALATRMLAAGDDIRTVSGRLGHADPSTTLRIYAHWVPEKDRAAADRIGAEF